MSVTAGANIGPLATGRPSAPYVVASGRRRRACHPSEVRITYTRPSNDTLWPLPPSALVTEPVLVTAPAVPARSVSAAARRRVRFMAARSLPSPAARRKAEEVRSRDRGGRRCASPVRDVPVTVARRIWLVVACAAACSPPAAPPASIVVPPPSAPPPPP